MVTCYLIKRKPLLRSHFAEAMWWSFILWGWEFRSSDSVSPWGGNEQNNVWHEACLDYKHLEPTQRTSFISGSAPSTSSRTLLHPLRVNLPSHVILISPAANGVISISITQGAGPYPRHQRERAGLEPQRVSSFSQGQYRHTNIHNCIYNIGL